MRRRTAALLGALLFFLVGVAAGWAKNRFVTPAQAGLPNDILLLGTDLRPGWTTSRSDVIMVVHLDPARRRLELLSVPRDTMVVLPHYGRQKINAAFAFGGPKLAMATVGALLGVRIRAYAYTDFPGFVRIMDALGGVTMDVPEDMYYQASDVHIDLHKGYQHLDGAQILELVRYRELPLGDIAREEDQQALLGALFHQAFSAGTLLRLPTLLPTLLANVHTNLSAGQVLALGEELRRCRGGILAETLPGAFLDLAGISYWEVIPADARAAWRDLLAGRRQPLFDPAAEREASLLGTAATGG